MILVDIYFVCIDQTYDFNLDEETPIGVLIDEIAEMVSQKEKIVLEGSSDKFYLCHQKEGTILQKHETLSTCNIKTGDYLIMV